VFDEWTVMINNYNATRTHFNPQAQLLILNANRELSLRLAVRVSIKPRDYNEVLGMLST
jgi:hypothetical protein